MESKGNKSVHKGRIEVITGGMFSGKSEELHRRIRRSIIAGLEVMMFQPSIDTRSEVDKASTRLGNEIPAKTVFNSWDIPMNLKDLTKVVGIDEAQFFDIDLIGVVTELADSGIQVIVAGLDQDFSREPFGPMPGIMAIAEYVDKIHAVCVGCGGDASYSYRTSGEEDQVVIGDTEAYEARCRNCYLIP